MASSQECSRDSRRRRIALFRNNWGTDVKQVDEEDADDMSDIHHGSRSPKSPISSKLNFSDKLLSSPLALLSPMLNSRIEKVGNSSSDGIPQYICKPLATNNHSNRNESYCKCKREKKNLLSCRCGEENDACEWLWDEANSSGVQLDNEMRDVLFHPKDSCGTATIRGTAPLEKDQYFWEIKMISPVYGTDMMIGVGTEDVQLDRYKSTFRGFLGEDKDAWGLSYSGLFHHNKDFKSYAPRFGQGSIIGVHLDMWTGQLSYYLNRMSLGIAHSSFRGRGQVYPIVCSTAARSAMRLITSRSFPSSLQYMCCVQIRKAIPPNKHVLDVVSLPPGLKRKLKTNLNWLLRPTVLDTVSNKRTLEDAIVSQTVCKKFKV